MLCFRVSGICYVVPVRGDAFVLAGNHLVRLKLQTLCCPQWATFQVTAQFLQSQLKVILSLFCVVCFLCVFMCVVQELSRELSEFISWIWTFSSAFLSRSSSSLSSGCGCPSRPALCHNCCLPSGSSHKRGDLTTCWWSLLQSLDTFPKSPCCWSFSRAFYCCFLYDIQNL